MATTSGFNPLKMFKPGGPWEMVERLQRVNYGQPPYSTRYPMLARLAEDFAKGEQDALQRTLPKDNIIRCNISTGPHFLGLGAQTGLTEVKVENNLISNSMVLTGSPTGDGHARTYAYDDKTIETILERTGNIIRFADPGLVQVQHGLGIDDLAVLVVLQPLDVAGGAVGQGSGQAGNGRDVRHAAQGRSSRLGR